jgi:hypothetical protein
MAVGREIGAFAMKSTSVTLTPGKAGSVTLHINYEGAATGELDSEVFSTMIVESSDGKDGAYRISARCFLRNGDIVDANGHGKTVHGHGNTWSVAGVTELVSGKSWAIRGDIDLTEKSFNGKMFERI